MGSLFDSCLHVILGDSRLTEGAALYLPSSISHYILYEAIFNNKDESIIEKLVAKWSHPSLSFDYYSNSLLRNKTVCAATCIQASEFYNIDSTINLSDGVYQSIIRGLLSNVQSHQSQGVEPALQHVDMVNIHTDHHKAAILLCLTRGDYLATSKYGGASGTRTTGKEGQRLFNITPLKTPVTVCINISLHSKFVSIELLSFLSAPGHFKITVSGVDLTSNTLNCQEVTHILKALKLSTPLKTIHINPSLINGTDHLPSIQPHGSLLLHIPQGTEQQHCIDVIMCILGTVRSLKDFVVVSYDTSTIQEVLLAVAKKVKITSLRLLKDTNAAETSGNVKEIMRTTLPCFTNSLEFLQLYQTTLTELPLTTLQQCSTLHVLSIIESDSDQSFKLTNTPSDCFNAIANLNCLQYFEWAATCNLRTADVLALHQTLSHSLPHLQHCHLYLRYILLFTTDLSKQEYLPIMSVLRSLLDGLSGDESCSTYRFSFTGEKFIHWLQTVRPVVCIKCVHYNSYCENNVIQI